MSKCNIIGLAISKPWHPNKCDSEKTRSKKQCDELGVIKRQRTQLTPWRNGSASDSRSEGCVFKSRRGQLRIFLDLLLEQFLKKYSYLFI